MIQTAADHGTPLQTDAAAPRELALQPSLEVRRLHRYFGRLKAVNNVSFRAYPGQVMGFIGPNGAGKTTAMRIIATLDMPTAGDVFVCGYSVVDDPDKVRRLLGFMPDSFGKYSNMNVLEYLDFFARAYGYHGTDRRDAIERVMEFTELDKLAEKPVKALSKGMSQRLGLGRTLIHDPQVLVLDEPAAGLDPRARVELRELIRLLATQMNKTVLISSHILTELGEICDSASIIEAGRLLETGTIEELRDRRRKAALQESSALAIRVLENAAGLERWLHEQPFTSEIRRVNDVVTCHFAQDAAGLHALLKRALEADFRVIEFRGDAETLEDAFMAITQGITQ